MAETPITKQPSLGSGWARAVVPQDLPRTNAAPLERQGTGNSLLPDTTDGPTSPRSSPVEIPQGKGKVEDDLLRPVELPEVGSLLHQTPERRRIRNSWVAGTPDFDAMFEDINSDVEPIQAKRKTTSPETTRSVDETLTATKNSWNLEEEPRSSSAPNQHFIDTPAPQPKPMQEKRVSKAVGFSQSVHPSSPKSTRNASPLRTEASRVKNIGSYQLGEELGRGAFGTVYKGIHTRTGDIVAVKQLRLKTLKPNQRQDVRNEIDLLRQINDNDNVVQYLGCIEEDEALNIVLEYAEGGSLHDMLKKFGVFPETLIKVFITQVLMGLEYLHGRGVVHRDVKGANILLTKNGFCKLADFGTSVLLDSVCKHVSFVGTPYWMSPEVITRSGMDDKCDIWSLGCVVVEMLTGKPPYFDLGPMAAMFRITDDDHPPIPDNLSENLDHFIHCCFQKDPESRYSAKELLNHPWILENEDSQQNSSDKNHRKTRCMTIVEAESILQVHNEKRLTQQGIGFYHDSMILGEAYNDASFSKMLEELDSQADPVDILSLAETHIHDIWEDLSAHKTILDRVRTGSLSIPPKNQEVNDRRLTFVEEEMQMTLTVESEETVTEIVADGAGQTSMYKIIQENREPAKNTSKMGTEEELPYLHIISMLKKEEALLLKTSKELQNQLGMILSEKKKATTIAKKLQAKLDEEKMERKAAVANLQAFKNKQMKIGEDPEVVAMRSNEVKHLAAIRFLSDCFSSQELALRIYKNLSPDHIRMMALEGWLFVRVFTKAGNRDSREIRRLMNERCRVWAVLRDNFLFCYQSDKSDAPLLVHQVDTFTIEEEEKKELESNDIRMRQLVGKMEIVEREVARWMGADEDQETVQKKKKTRVSLNKSKGKKGKTASRERGKFVFRLTNAEEELEFGCDSGNLMNMWVEAIQNCRMWYEDWSS